MLPVIAPLELLTKIMKIVIVVLITVLLVTPWI